MVRRISVKHIQNPHKRSPDKKVGIYTYKNARAKVLIRICVRMACFSKNFMDKQIRIKKNAKKILKKIASLDKLMTRAIPVKTS